jgi:hypothetical protein
MQSYQQSKQIQTRRPVLIFLKQVGPPIVLYVDDSEALYNELKQVIANVSSSSPKLIEKTAKGPVKKLCVLDTQIAGIVIQEEAFTA